MILGAAGFEVLGAGETMADLDAWLSGDAEAAPVVIMGALGGPGLIGCIERVLALRPQARIVVLTDLYDQSEAIAAMQQGAKAYLHKNLSAESFVKALHLVSEECSVISGWPVGSARRSVAPPPPVAPAAIEPPGADAVPADALPAPAPGMRALSPREMAILRMLTDGAPNKQIARALAITESTVKVHIKTILRKIQVRNRTQAAIRAMAEPELMQPMPPPAAALRMPPAAAFEPHV